LSVGILSIAPSRYKNLKNVFNVVSEVSKYINRFKSEVRIFRVLLGNNKKWQVTRTQVLPVRTAMHSIQDDKIDVTLTTSTIYGTVEGRKSLGIKPGIQEFKWENGFLRVERYAEIPNIDADDTIHHYSITSDQKYLYIPTYGSPTRDGRVHVLRLSDMAWTKDYAGVYGGGHINFSYKHNVGAVTGHFDDRVALVNLNGTGTTFVKINNDERGYPPKQGLLQSHSNWISPDQDFFYICNSHSGEFVEVDLSREIVSRKLFVGGHPEQSIS